MDSIQGLIMSEQEKVTDESSTDTEIPIKRVDGETLEDRLTSNAYNNILPARYLKKDDEGNIIEDAEEIFERVGHNVAMAELVYLDEDIMVEPNQLKADHHKREKLCREIFGEDVDLTDDVEIKLTEDNVYAFDYNLILPELPEEIADQLKQVGDMFMEEMGHLKFMPNTPTLINAGDDMQQLSACFVLSPEDSLSDIHEKAAEAADIFQSGGGTGYAFHKLRPYGDTVTSTGGQSSGTLPFMNTFDQVCETIAQGGVRRGAQMGIMKIDHPDVPYFIHSKNKAVSLAKTLRLNDPDDFTHMSFGEALEEARELIDEEGRVPEHLRNAVEGHLSNFNISVGVTTEFMEAVFNDETYTLTNPRTGEAHIATEETKEMYGWFDLDQYVEVGESLELPANEIWDRIIDGAYENGEPGVIYLERANDLHSFDVEEYPDKKINATNPCVAEGTLVNTPHGYRPVEEVDVGDTISTVYGSETVDEIEVHHNYPVQTVQFSNGTSLEVTEQHRFHVLDGNQVKEIPLSELEEGDTIRLHPTELDDKGTPEEYQFYAKKGILLGGGFYTETDLGTSNTEKYDVEQRRNRTEITSSEKNNSVSMVAPNVTAEVSNTQTETTTTPTEEFEVTELNTELSVMGVLDGLLATSGSITFDDTPCITWNQLSNDIAESVRQSLQLVGMNGTISTTGPRDTNEYTVTISGSSAEAYANMSQIEEVSPEKADQLDTLRRNYMTTGDSWTAEINSIENSGTAEAVYDLYCEGSDTWITEGFVQQGCGEQPLMEYEACNLGHINLSTIVDKDVTRWYELYESEEGFSEEEIAEFVEQAIDFEELDRRIELGTRFLDNVITMSDFPVDKIGKSVSIHRKIGLGIMGLAQMYVQIGVRYGSDVANEIGKQIMMHINHESKQVSQKLAEERGNFQEWDKSKYANPTQYPNWFEKYVGEDPEDWEDGFPIRNHNTTTVAPTGTTSMLGNTTGGCEPMYNIAYYKNVSDDVQGEDMLDEYDDYFIRTLEANDIPVEPMKEEARELMENNEFSASNLTTVPETIKNLFVTTEEIPPIEHARLQCAIQHGVDSSISKTVNAPNDDDKDNARRVFEEIYKLGGKGVTYYRDGTRSKQVLTTRAQNTEFSAEDISPEETLDLVDEQMEDEWFRQELAELLLDVAQENSEEELTVEEFVNELGMGVVGKDTNIQPTPRSRDKRLYGRTEKVTTGYGSMYVTINEDEEGLVEVFTQIGKSGGFMNSFTESVARLVSMSLRSGIPAEDVIDSLEDIRSPKIAWDEGDKIQSIPDGIATAMRRYLNSEERALMMAIQGVNVETGEDVDITEDQVSLLSTVVDDILGDGSLDELSANSVPIPSEPEGEIGGVDVDSLENTTEEEPVDLMQNGNAEENITTENNGREIVDSPEDGDFSDPICPECQSTELYYSEGCKTCEQCGWSEC